MNSSLIDLSYPPTPDQRITYNNPPIGIVLCADKSDTLVEYTLPENNRQIFAAKYLPYMPTKEELKRELNLEDFRKA